MVLHISILTISDRSARGQRADESGPSLAEAVRAQGWVIDQMKIVPDEREIIEKTLINWTDEGKVEIILTTGGTGFSPRDITPEATLKVIERQAPGLAEAMRQSSLAVTPHAMLSRAVAGIRRRTLIVNLPGNPKAALENLQVILPVLPHAAQLLAGDSRAEADHHRLG
jgi:molybdenum cofactor synthesis domain-containing protein